MALCARRNACVAATLLSPPSWPSSLCWQPASGPTRVSPARTTWVPTRGNVAVWRGLPGKPLGLTLHWLESETSIKLSDLPEDTQNRLKAGIPQTSVDDAQDTISKYRHQIDEEQTRQVIDAQTIRDNTNQGSTSESDSEKTAEQSAEAEASEKN